MNLEISDKKRPSLIGIIHNPLLQFKRIQEKPVIWFPLILLSALAMLVAVFVTMTFDYEAITQMEMSRVEEESAKTFAVIVGAIGGLIGTPVSYLVFAAILFGIAKLLKSMVSFKQMLSFIIFISFISMIGQILNQAFIAIINGDPSIMITSINSVIKADGALGAALGVIELFSLWYYTLLTIGLVKIADLSKVAAYSISIFFFSLSLIIASLGGAIEGYTQL